MRILHSLAVSVGLSALCGAASANDWQGLADTLTAAGVRPAVTYEGGPAANLSGGQICGATYSNNLLVQLSFDGNQLVGMPGLSAYLNGLWISGGDPSKLVGDAQGVSNIAGPGAVRIYEAWVQYNIPSGAFSVLAGRYDLNTESISTSPPPICFSTARSALALHSG